MKIVFVLSLLSLAHAAMYEGGTRQPTHVSCRSVLHKTDNSLTRKDVKLFNSCCNSLGGCTVNCYIPNTSVVKTMPFPDEQSRKRSLATKGSY